jgi:hypothetical protein
VTDEQAAWLHAQIDEDERWAQEASRDGDRYTPAGEHWRWECEDTDTPATIDPMLSEYVEGVDGAPVGLRSVEGYPSTWGATLHHIAIRGQEELPAGVAGHIIRHDPARVLAEVDAKRRRLDLHQPVLLRKGGGADYFVTARVCMTCGGSDASFTDGTPAMRAAAYPCPTLRLEAAPYADRPGYQEMWGKP